MSTVKMSLESREGRRVIKMDVEEQLLIGFRESFTEFALNGAVTGADVML